MQSKLDLRWFITAGASRLVNYGIILFGGLVLFLPSFFLPPLSPATQLLSACNYTILCSSYRTPWGTITSLFMFDSWNNLLLFLDVTVVFLIANFVFSPTETKRRCIFALVSMFASGVIPNLVLVVIHPADQVFGPSGVVYGFIGVVMGLSVFNLFPSRWEGLTLRSLREYYRVLRNMALTVLNAFVLVVLVGFLVKDPSQFLSAGPNVNILGHSLGFVIGFASAYVYGQRTRSKW